MDDAAEWMLLVIILLAALPLAPIAGRVADRVMDYFSESDY